MQAVILYMVLMKMYCLVFLGGMLPNANGNKFRYQTFVSGAFFKRTPVRVVLLLEVNAETLDNDQPPKRFSLH